MISSCKFADYCDAIAALPLKDKMNPWYERSELITDRFLLFQDGPLSAYYVPFHYMNPKARVVLVGLTPGWTQMELAFRTARQCLAEGVEGKAMFGRIERQSAFAGAMRRNLANWLNCVGLNAHLKLVSCSELFDGTLLQSTSAVSAAIFRNGKNYTGHSPSLLTLPKFKEFIVENIAVELRALPNAVIVPLGKSAGEIVQFLHDEHLISLDRCLLRFPHPSGANGHRNEWFAVGRDRWRGQLAGWFSSATAVSVS